MWTQTANVWARVKGAWTLYAERLRPDAAAQIRDNLQCRGIKARLKYN